MANWQPVQVPSLYTWLEASVYIAEAYGKRLLDKGARSIFCGCSCSRRVYMSVLFIVVRVRVKTRSSLYTTKVRDMIFLLIWRT